jgi:hypothetical protein
MLSCCCKMHAMRMQTPPRRQPLHACTQHTHPMQRAPVSIHRLAISRDVSDEGAQCFQPGRCNRWAPLHAEICFDAHLQRCRTCSPGARLKASVQGCTHGMQMCPGLPSRPGDELQYNEVTGHQQAVFPLRISTSCRVPNASIVGTSALYASICRCLSSSASPSARESAAACIVLWQNATMAASRSALPAGRLAAL